ncbi:WD40 repeat domain-containing protein [Streptomyces vilmorinianum]|uniref:WD40 repeat domain-containing protein n=1 Tax=Streptomyces vilmorinianum TaxID=3051092 RepID=UPI0010FB8F25|nr:WD40 repeat domain-containing protein [Streptomyces vilmorinianum]
MNKYTVMAAGLVLSLGFVAGCGSSDGPEADKPSEKASSRAPQSDTKAAGPVYKGPAIPGLADKQAWSLPRAEAIDLGDTLLFVKNAAGEYSVGGNFKDEPIDGTTGTLHDTDQPEPVNLEFRDVRTGAVRKTLTVTADRVAATTWRDGVPALEVRTSSTTESDGLSAEGTTATVTVYGSDGAELGKAEHTGDTPFHVHEGHLIEQADEATLQLTPIGGGQPRKVTCGGLQASCSFDPRNKDIDGGQGHAPLITGKYTFHVENGSTYETAPEELVMSDLATGEKVWSTADVTPPEGVELNDKGVRTSGGIRVLDVREGRILTAWGAGAFLTDTWVTATYDLASGKQIGGSTKYAYADFPGDTVNTEGSSVFSPDHQLAAAATERGSTVWQLADGKEVWAQKENEKAMTPLRFSPSGVLYGTTEDSQGTVLAVDARTKKVLAKDLPSDNVPLFSRPSGYGYFSTDDGFFVFPSASQ